MEEDIQERERLRLCGGVPKYISPSSSISGEASPDLGSTPSESLLEEWHAKLRDGVSRPRDGVEEKGEEVEGAKGLLVGEKGGGEDR